MNSQILFPSDIPIMSEIQIQGKFSLIHRRRLFLEPVLSWVGFLLVQWPFVKQNQIKLKSNGTLQAPWAGNVRRQDKVQFPGKVLELMVVYFIPVEQTHGISRSGKKPYAHHPGAYTDHHLLPTYIQVYLCPLSPPSVQMIYR